MGAVPNSNQLTACVVRGILKDYFDVFTLHVASNVGTCLVTYTKLFCILMGHRLAWSLKFCDITVEFDLQGAIQLCVCC